MLEHYVLMIFMCRILWIAFFFRLHSWQDYLGAKGPSWLATTNYLGEARSRVVRQEPWRTRSYRDRQNGKQKDKTQISSDTSGRRYRRHRRVDSTTRRRQKRRVDSNKTLHHLEVWSSCLESGCSRVFLSQTENLFWRCTRQQTKSATFHIGGNQISTLSDYYYKIKVQQSFWIFNFENQNFQKEFGKTIIKTDINFQTVSRKHSRVDDFKFNVAR